MHLDKYLHDSCPEGYIPEWDEVLAYCLGYYNFIDLDILFAVKRLQLEGRIN
jgi:hypothetical protein